MIKWVVVDKIEFSVESFLEIKNVILDIDFFLIIIDKLYVFDIRYMDFIFWKW